MVKYILFSGTATLDDYINLLMTNESYPSSLRIPGPSNEAVPIQFGQENMVKNGLINDANNCCLISIIQALHRIKFEQHFIEIGRMSMSGNDDLLNSRIYSTLQKT